MAHGCGVHCPAKVVPLVLAIAIATDTANNPFRILHHLWPLRIANGSSRTRQPPRHDFMPASTRMFRCMAALAAMLVLCGLPQRAGAAPLVADTIAQRVQACTGCHGSDGRAASDGYYPRIAGKPAGYLFNQLVHFREGTRRYAPMNRLVALLDDDYLREIAEHFAALDLPYAPHRPAPATPTVEARGETLAKRGDPALGIPACAGCHGEALTGVRPATPGLLGLPRDYLSAQLGAWKVGNRKAAAPDCMAQIARRLTPADIGAVSIWLAGRTPPASARPATTLAKPPPLECGTVSGKPARDAPPVLSADAVRGEYLARAGNCAACHTARGGRVYAGGRGIETPFGSVFSTNLTPDAATGIGRWSGDDFWRALHEGRSRDGRALYPAFPYPSFTRVTRADADAIFAYLRSLAPVRQANRSHALRFPYDSRVSLSAWRGLYFRPATFEPDGSRSAQWNRGAYLVQGLGHCNQCHAARNALGATADSPALAGGMIPVQNWYAPSLLSAAQAGVAHWKIDEVVSLLKTGVAPQASASGPMAEVVRGATQHLNDADLRAMAVYLRSLPNADIPPRPTPARSEPAWTALGATLYERHCAGCHGSDGEGVGGRYPRLAGNRAVTLDPPANVIHMLLEGGFAPATRGNPRPFGMPPYATLLSDRDIAAVASYIRRTWDNRAAAVTAFDVTRYRGDVRE